MDLSRSEPALLLRIAVSVILLLLATSLALGGPLAPETGMRWVSLIVLGLALADVLVVALDFARGRWLGAAPAAAALAALRRAGQLGAIATLGFAGGWLLFQPRDAASVASFALLESMALLTMLSSAQLQPAAQPVRPGWAGRRRPHRLLFSLAASGAVAAVLLSVGWQSLVAAPRHELACPLLPSGVIPVAGLHDSRCPFRPFDRVVEVWVPGARSEFRGLADLREKAARWPEFVEWTVERGNLRLSAPVPVLEVSLGSRVGRFTTALLLAATMMAIALIIAWNTASRAALPFLVFCSLVSASLAAALCAGSNEYLRLIGALSTAMYPPALAHLGLRYPRDRLAGSSAAILPGYYATGALVCGLLLLGFQRSAPVWILVEHLVPVFAFVAWGALLLSSLVVLRRSSAPLERARARGILAGSLAVVGAALLLGETSDSHSPPSYRTGMLAVVLLQVPVAAALVRYSIFDLHPLSRRVVASLAYAVFAAGALTLLAMSAASARFAALPLGHEGLLFSALLLCALAAETLRGWLQGPGFDLLSAAAHRRRAVALRCARQLAELRDPDGYARIIAETLVEALRASWVAVFLRSPELGLRPAHVLGEGAPLSLELARRADALAAAGDVVHLSRAEAGEAQEYLAAAGVDVVLPLHSAAGAAGLVLLGHREEAVPYTFDELDYLRALGAQAAVALDNARMARDLVDAGRNAARGHVAVGLAHELGKPLRVIEDLARSLERITDRDRARRDLQQIASISDELIRSVYGFVHEVRSQSGRRGAAVADVVARAVHTVQHLHGPDRVSLSMARDLPDVNGGDELVTVLSNLLDNALLASQPEDSVHLFATADASGLRFEVVDDGHGMDATTAARAFELFFTTRSGRGGNGVGLALCREIVAQLGGSIELSSRPGKGTRVAVRLPLAPAA